MKIVDRKTFLALPVGTLFFKYEPINFGHLGIKMESVCGDFCAQYLDEVKSSGSSEMVDIMLRVQDSGESFELDFDYYGRDGLFDADQRFAVFENSDVSALIARIQRAQSENQKEPHA